MPWSTDIDECTTGSNPCVRGICVNTIGSVECDCRNTGYTGDTCDVGKCVVIHWYYTSGQFLL